MNVPGLSALLAAATFACLAAAQTGPASVKSPDGSLELTISDTSGGLTYRVAYRGKTAVDWSHLGLAIQGQEPLGPQMRILGAEASEGDETWTAVAGKASQIRNRYRAVTVHAAEPAGLHRRLDMEARAYDDGVAFRYMIPQQEALREVRIAKELTEFRMAKDATTCPLILGGYRTSYEDDYHELPLSGVHEDYLVALPLLMEVPGVAWVALTEADIENYAGMYVQRGRDPRTLEARLAPRVDEPGLAVGAQTPMRSPWRVLLIAAEVGRLVESNMVMNLNPPCALQDTSWIKPGKTAWDWWSGSVARNVTFQAGMNTATMKYYIDFAARNGIPYMLIDAGWSKQGGGPFGAGGDLTQTSPDINLPELMEYAKARNVGIWLWAHWTDVDRQIDQAFPLFEKWGVVGVKIDFMDRDDQWMVEWYRRTVKKAAEHKLMVDFHGAFKPDGLRRTYPNLLTREGVMGMEYSKWSARITPKHNVTLAFTRMLAGPMDYTPGGFENVTKAAFQPRFQFPMVMGTRAHQLGLYVVFESGLQMLADDSGAYEGQKELEFLRAAPVAWDETRVLEGVPAKYIAIARRKGAEWYVGAITDWDAREIELPLSFLGSGAYSADWWADAPDAAAEPKHTVRKQREVDARTVLKLELAPGGGAALRLRPAGEER
jgi:alpha-glucosidase